MKVRITKVPDKKSDSLNARKWKHGDGGLIDRMYEHSGGDAGKMLELIKKAKGM